MYIKGRTVTFDNGLVIDFEENYDSLKNKITDGEKLLILDEALCVSFYSQEMVGGFREDTSIFCDDENEEKVYSIELEFDVHAYAGKDFESYFEFADYNKKLFNELREYLLEQFGQEKVAGNSDSGFGIKDGNLILGLNTGRGFEHVKINIVPEDDPLHRAAMLRMAERIQEENNII